jgi:hypothetical protein
MWHFGVMMSRNGVPEAALLSSVPAVQWGLKIFIAASAEQRLAQHGLSQPPACVQRECSNPGKRDR